MKSNGDHGFLNAEGYRVIRHDGRYVFEHRKVMEDKLGRPLLPGEVVHHIDRNRQNSSPENLLLLPNQSAHRQLHIREDGHKSHCKWGHEYNQENSYMHPSGVTICRTCIRKHDREYKERQRMKKELSQIR